MVGMAEVQVAEAEVDTVSNLLSACVLYCGADHRKKDRSSVRVHCTCL